MITYLDTSAVAKLLADEPESQALRAHLDDRVAAGHADLVSACLLETELRRLATRTGIPQTAVTDVLSRLALMDMDRSVFREAGLLTGTSLRSLDALHIAAALQASANEFITYDARQQAAAEAVGLRVYTPRTELAEPQ
ncbi:type II toxin-antitoxin system VapC family toxin [Cryobacterium sp. PH31-O1]|uniref:type II toxin-antitoxin system VapC family toxin n=1 Tax=Cryobacterium sp. PH31-O1 TaxID=3046306 RepID=UPI0024BBE336|nr:type II toxin-antitoxin system VapC family toxin [Cryobacterium sp. PH31-O1]MDJ0337567.1 type II toxin-antitoxin system VapC family toxin [Cryobacterium sp. PH31-O1]